MLLAQRAALPQGRFDIISSVLVGNYNKLRKHDNY